MTAHVTIRQIATVLGISKRGAEIRAENESWEYVEESCRGGQRRLYLANKLPSTLRDAILTERINDANANRGRVDRCADSAGRLEINAGKLTGFSVATRGRIDSEQRRTNGAHRPGLPRHRDGGSGSSSQHDQPAAHELALPASAQDLTDIARDAGLARITLLDEIYRVGESSGVNRAVKKIEELSRAGQLPEHLRELAPLVNAKRGQKDHLLSHRTLRRWLSLDKPNATPSERIARLAPRTQGRDYMMPDDVGAVLKLYRQPNKPALARCAQEVARAMNADWHSLYHRAVRFKRKVPAMVFHGGRNSGAALKALQVFRRREFLSLAPNDVWTGDGHGMKFKVAHPETGAPFVPEVTVIMDVGQRYIVGWSVSYSENCIAVSAALRHAIQTHGLPLIYYSDNGGGQKNKTFDAPVTGILGALNIRHETGIPGNPQGRGVIERSWRTVTIPLAKRFATYHGHGADRDTLKKVTRDIAKALRAGKNGEVTPLPRRLPTFAEFIEALDAAIADYNTHHEHGSLPKINGRHATPAAWRAHRLTETGADIVMLQPQELATLFMPAVLRKAIRGEVRFINCTYFHKDLMLVDGETVKVHHDIHDVQRVWVKKLSGELIAEAVLDGNKAGYFPRSMIEIQRTQRADRRVALKQSQIDAINDERTPPAMIDQTTGAPLVPLEIKPELIENVVSLPTAAARRPMFDSDAEKYRFLLAHRDDIATEDDNWINWYRTTSEWLDLFGDEGRVPGGDDFEMAARV